MVCAALFSDKKWKRAEIVSVPGKAQIEAFSLDYGDSEIISWKNIRKLNHEYISLDAQVYFISDSL